MASEAPRALRISLLDRQELAPLGPGLAVNFMAQNPPARLLLPGVGTRGRIRKRELPHRHAVIIAVTAEGRASLRHRTRGTAGRRRETRHDARQGQRVPGSCTRVGPARHCSCSAPPPALASPGVSRRFTLSGIGSWGRPGNNGRFVGNRLREKAKTLVGAERAFRDDTVLVPWLQVVLVFGATLGKGPNASRGSHMRLRLVLQLLPVEFRMTHPEVETGRSPRATAGRPTASALCHGTPAC